MKENRDALLREVVERIKSRYNIVAIILFGSRARGDHTPWSDYDLLVIADFYQPYLDRIRDILEAIGDIPLPIEPHPYTLEEAIEMLKKGNPTIYDALDEGILLYSSERFNKLKELFRVLKEKGMVRTETTIIIPSNE